MRLIQGRPCAICDHPDRMAINALILEPASNESQVAARTGCGVATVRRHIKRHMMGVKLALERDARSRDILAQEGLAGQVKGLLVEALEVLEAARFGDIAGRVSAIRTCRELLETLGKISGEIAAPSIQNYLVNVLNVRSEAEAKQAVALARAGSKLTHEEAFEEALWTLDLLLKSHPLWYPRAHSFVTQRESYAEVVA